jgi:hypothetical protein
VGVLGLLLLKLAPEVVDDVLVLFVVDAQVAYLVLVLDYLRKHFLQVALGLHLLVLQQFLALLEPLHCLLRLLPESLELGLQLADLRYLLLEVDEDVLVGGQLVDGHFDFGEEDVRGQDAFVGAHFLLDGVVLRPHLHHLLLLLLLERSQPQLQQVVLLLILGGLLAEPVHLALLLLEQRLCPLFRSLRLLQLPVVAKLDLLQLAVEVGDLTVLLHQLDLVLSHRQCTNSIVSTYSSPFIIIIKQLTILNCNRNEIVKEKSVAGKTGRIHPETIKRALPLHRYHERNAVRDDEAGGIADQGSLYQIGREARQVQEEY